MAVARMTPRGSKVLEHPFRLRANVPLNGEGELILVGPVDATPDFCVAYAFWQTALSIDVGKWRRYHLRTCDRDRCRRKFFDRRWVMKGGPRLYCSAKCQIGRND
jgi:hypothetical protein